jgi:hypothetical protein
MTIGEPVHEAGHDTLARGEGAELEELGECIAALAAQISAATYELLAMLRDFDERGGWNSGFRSCAHWLCWRVGLDPGAAREKVRVARALGALPLLSAAMRRGEISYSKVRALTRIATPANEADLLSFARAGTAAHVERLIRGMRRVDRAVQREAGDDEERRHAARYLRAYTDEDGMVVVTGRLAPEAGAALLRALDAGVEALHGPRRGQSSGAAQEAADDASAEQRRADALGLVAESALASGLDPGSRGDRYQVVVHVDAEVLAAGGEGGSSWLADGSHVSAEGAGAAGVGTRARHDPGRATREPRRGRGCRRDVARLVGWAGRLRLGNRLAAVARPPVPGIRRRVTDRRNRRPVQLVEVRTAALPRREAPFSLSLKRKVPSRLFRITPTTRNPSSKGE